jgi:hypothetical protein
MSGGGGSNDGSNDTDVSGAEAVATGGSTYSDRQIDKSVGYGGADDNREAARGGQYSTPEAKAVAARDPSFGDPDPEVDVPTDKRQDTITSFSKNLQANVKANPLMATPGGIAYTAFQTGMANSMLGNITSRGGVGGETQGGEGEREFVRQVTPLAPYAIRGEIAPKSQAMNWYKNLGENTQTAFNFSEGYATAKARQQGILGTPSPIKYHAVSESPFFSFLRDNSLNKGIL